MPRFRELVRAVFAEHEAEFIAFKEVHDKYAKDDKKWQGEFNTRGAIVMEYLRVAEKDLCGKTERSGNGVYSSRLADKFWAEVKAYFPLIDFVGIKIS